MTNTISITLQSTTLVLAYLHYYNCKFLPGRCLQAQHLRVLSNWLQQPDRNLLTASNHPMLAAHLALLKGSKLLAYNNVHWYLTTHIFQWLEMTSSEQYKLLMQTIDTCQFETAGESLGIAERLTGEVKVKIYKQLQHLTETDDLQGVENAR